MCVKAYLDLSLNLLCSLWLLRLGTCTWEPGWGVPGCRGGLCPCLFAAVLFGFVFQETL